MTNDASAYGLWSLVAVNSLVFLVFAFSFFRPKTKHDWRTYGAFAGFIIALFTEMYGFPLTVYLLSGWLARLYPNLDLFSHNAGHLWSTVLGGTGDAHFGLVHLVSNLAIVAGFVILIRSWRVLHEARRNGRLATTGPYGRVRHPQYAAFLLIMAGFLFQWPTLPTLLMFPVLVVMYYRLARKEEKEVQRGFGAEYALYAAATPAFSPWSGLIARRVKTGAET